MWDVAKTLQISLNLSTFIFMVASLLDMGLRLELEEALRGLRNVRFVALSLLAGFVMCPALAYLLTKVVPLERPYAIGMILLSMTPCAPFLPIMVDRARGDLSYAAAFMLLASVVTPIYMPLAVPLLAQGLAADAWTIAKPVLLFILLPLLIGIAIRLASAPLATRLQPLAKTAAAVSTILIVVLIVILYGRGFVSAMGSYAFGTQILFFSVTIAATYGLSFGLPETQRSVLAVGMSTRNLGAALTPLLSVQDVDQRAIVMVAIGVPMQIIASMLAAHWLAGRAPTCKPSPSTAD